MGRQRVNALYELDGQWISRENSQSLYRFWTAGGRTRRQTLKTADIEIAKQRLTAIVAEERKTTPAGWTTPEREFQPPGKVYFVQSGTDGLIKIGWTGSDPRKRIASLRTGSAVAIKLLAAFDGNQALEKRLHRLFAREWRTGEWFLASPRLLRLVNTIRAKRRPADLAMADIEALAAALNETELADDLPYRVELLGADHAVEALLAASVRGGIAHAAYREAVAEYPRRRVRLRRGARIVEET